MGGVRGWRHDRWIGRATVAAVIVCLQVAGGGCAVRRPALSAESGARRAAASPVRTGDERTIEAVDGRLKSALARLRVSGAVDDLQAAAAEYHRLGVFDRAEALLTRALDRDRRNAHAWAARARVWRDWGRPDLALGDATRAVAFAPSSVDALNTLGTVQFALGRHDEAESSFERALSEAPEASWVLNNLCYVALMRGDERGAVARCEAALALDPALDAARNNLATAHAMAGRFPDARRVLLGGPDRAAALYNLGILMLGARDVAGAAQAFTEACRDRPAFDEACDRALDARRRVLGAGPARR